MIKPEAITSSKYEFDCEVNPLQLSEAQLEELGLDPCDYMQLEVNLKASGSFVIEWDDDIPMVQIESFVVEGAPIPNKIIITPMGDISARHFTDLDDTQVDFDYLAEKIEQYGDRAYWEEDRQSSLIDAAESLFEDR